MRTRFLRSVVTASIAVVVPALSSGAFPVPLAGQDPAPKPSGDSVSQAPVSPQDAALLAEERAECDRLRRRGDVRAAIRRLDDLLDADPADAEALFLRARCRADQAEHEKALADARAALALPDAAAPIRAAAVRVIGRVLVTLGKSDEALATFEAQKTLLAPALDARDAWVIGRAAWDAGKREMARTVLDQGAQTGDDQPWEALVARGLCQRRLGRLEAASKTLVLALERSTTAGQLRAEPDVLAALGDLYFEADKEVAEAGRRAPAVLYREALEQHPTHEGALLGLHALHRYNWQRQRESASSILARDLAARPSSVDALVAAVSADLDDGQLKSARERLARLDDLAKERRDVRILHASLACIDRKTDECEQLLEKLLEQDPLDAAPEREVGRHLLELYRFAEGLPWVKRAAERDPADWDALTQLGRALANTGDEKGAKEALDQAQKAAAGRQDAWRNNMLLVLKRIEERHSVVTKGDLSFSWDPDGGEVLATYLIPFYTEARDELAQRYGFTPTPTRIEVFRAHKDFSVRSTGFEGFPALGVCFGPVVTAVSPLWEMRGSQSWARTSFHEFTHVIHLGLSHNRCPRWVTEGLATWEEVNRSPSWTRNMRRELVEALANDEVIPTRDLNRAFRGPRILFGYYQGGLMCQMLIEKHGFTPMVRLLEAFDRGLDLDAALQSVFKATPEDLDRQFDAFARNITKDLRLEPRWEPGYVDRLRVSLPQKPPADAKKRAAWVDGWCTVAWSMWQRDLRVDAQEALRLLKDVTPQPPRALFLRGSLALEAGDRETATKQFEAAIAAGGEDFKARIALASFAKDAKDDDACEKHLLAAEKAFPGYDDKQLSAELRLAAFYEEHDRTDDALAARERWLAWNGGEVEMRLEIAGWHVARGATDAKELDLALVQFNEINEIDPFLRNVHREWGDALRSAGKLEEALREYRMILAVPPELDAVDKLPLEDEQRAEVIGLQAACLLALGRNGEALERAKEALALDEDCGIARETLEKAQ